MLSYKIDLYDNNLSHSIEKLVQNNSTPVTFDSSGKVRNIYKDDIWCFVSQPYSFHCDFSELPSATKLESNNLRLTKQMVFLCLYNFEHISVKTLHSKWQAIRDLTFLANHQYVELDKISKHQLIIDSIATQIPRHHLTRLLPMFSELLLPNTQKTFIIATHDQILSMRKTLDRRLKNAPYGQTAYIPQRLHDALLTTASETVYEFCSIYDELISLTSNVKKKLSLSKTKGVQSDSIMSLEQKFIDESLSLSAKEIIAKQHKASSLKSILNYMHRVRLFCVILITNYSVARKNEVLSIEENCLIADTHPSYGEVFMLKGKTTKTQNNENALWVVSKETSKATEALMLLEKVRVSIQENAYTSTLLFQNWYINGRLGVKKYKKGKELSSPICAKIAPKYLNILSNEQFKVTESDLNEALAVTPSLNKRKVILGQPWQFALHQLRRTQIVRATKSSLVSRQSCSFQAKHRNHKATEYYTKGYWALKRMNDDSDLIKMTSNSLANEMTESYVENYNEDIRKIIDDERFFSTYGGQHKYSLFRQHPILTTKEVKTGLKRNLVRRTFAGLCVNSEDCEYSTALSVKGCLKKKYGKACAYSIIDSDSLQEINALIEDAENQLDTTNPRDMLLTNSLKEDIKYGIEAMNLILKRGQVK